MNLFAAAFSIAALISSVSAAITIVSPAAGGYWYTSVPNYMQITSSTAAETYASVRFTGCSQSFTLTVLTNSTVPVVLPRCLRGARYLDIYAISNALTTASTYVYVIDPMSNCPAPCASPCPSPCVRPCPPRRGCGYYAENNAEQSDVSQTELKFIAAGSEEDLANQAAHQEAIQHAIEDSARAFQAAAQQVSA